MELSLFKAFSMQSDTSYHLSIESALNRFKIASTLIYHTNQLLLFIYLVLINKYRRFKL